MANPVMSSDAADALDQLDQLVDDLMAAMGIPEPGDSGSLPHDVDPGVVATVQRIDALVDEMSSHLGLSGMGTPRTGMAGMGAAAIAACLDFARRHQ